MHQINEDITLVPYYPNEKVALEWYQDLELCKQVEIIPISSNFAYSQPMSFKKATRASSIQQM